MKFPDEEIERELPYHQHYGPDQRDEREAVVNENCPDGNVKLSPPDVPIAAERRQMGSFYCEYIPLPAVGMYVFGKVKHTEGIYAVKQ